MTVTYEHSPHPFSAPVAFQLTGDRLTVDTGRKVREVRLGAVESVRMAYEPGRLARRAFRTTIRMTDGQSVALSSLHWKSLVEAQELTTEYRRFVEALLHAVANASPETRFLAGQPAWRWWIGSTVAVLSLLGMALLIWQAGRRGASGVVLLGALLVGVGIWQLEPMVRLNKPRRFAPDSPPADLLP